MCYCKCQLDRAFCDIVQPAPLCLFFPFTHGMQEPEFCVWHKFG
uniref:Uncharacterized protein n=1 Tax=Rhizophora mucronata TaxID=61149 RepID=A0A2P2K9B8_RHIMU